jgi:hypothetical protein
MHDSYKRTDLIKFATLHLHLYFLSLYTLFALNWILLFHYKCKLLWFYLKPFKCSFLQAVQLNWICSGEQFRARWKLCKFGKEFWGDETDRQDRTERQRDRQNRTDRQDTNWLDSKAETCVRCTSVLRINFLFLILTVQFSTANVAAGFLLGLT